MNFEYFYGMEAEQFSFYRIPKLLIKDSRFKNLSSNAKLLYGLMLDRVALSVKNGWFDEYNRAYIIYTIESIMEDLCCAKATCVKTTKELIMFGLIEKKRMGQGKADIIYVKNFLAFSEVQNLNFKEFNSYTSRSSDYRPVEVQKLNPNNTNINKTNINNTEYINQSIGKSCGQPVKEIHKQKKNEIDKIDKRTQYVEFVKERLSYDILMNDPCFKDKDLYSELVNIICDVVTIPRKQIRINGEMYPYEPVRAKFLKLDINHVLYAIEALRCTTSEIKNIRAYMLTTLYNAPDTINNYYQTKVQHDLYG